MQREAVVTYDGSLVVEPTNFDSQGRPITTTAGEFIAGIERDRPIVAYHVSKNMAADPVWLDTHVGAVNLDPVKIRGRTRPPGTLKLVNPSGGPFQVENRVRFFVMSFDLLFDPLGHHVERWNMGTLKLVAKVLPNGRKKWVQEQIRTGSPPRPVEEPVPLDIKGQPLADFLASSEDGRPVDTTKLIKLKRDVQPVLKFNGIIPVA